MSLDLAALGHLLMDVRIFASSLPGPDEEAAIEGVSYGAGGSAANAAAAAARLGMRSGLIAKIGSDPAGGLVLEELRSRGVDTRGVVKHLSEPTGFSIVVIAPGGSVAVFGSKGASELLAPEDLRDLGDLIRESRALHIASMRLDTSAEAAKIARASGAMITWDPGRRLSSLGMGDSSVKTLLPLIDYVILNEKELRSLTGSQDHVEGARRLVEAGPRGAVVKRGPLGVYIAGKGLEADVRGFRVRAVDTTGAGDAFAAGFIGALLSGKDPVEACEYGNAVAAIKVTRLGAQAHPSREEVELFLKMQRSVGPVASISLPGTRPGPGSSPRVQGV